MLKSCPWTTIGSSDQPPHGPRIFLAPDGWLGARTEATGTHTSPTSHQMAGRGWLVSSLGVALRTCCPQNVLSDVRGGVGRKHCLRERGANETKPSRQGSFLGVLGKVLSILGPVDRPNLVHLNLVYQPQKEHVREAVCQFKVHGLKGHGDLSHARPGHWLCVKLEDSHKVPHSALHVFSTQRGTQIKHHTRTSPRPSKPAATGNITRNRVQTHWPPRPTFGYDNPRTKKRGIYRKTKIRVANICRVSGVGRTSKRKTQSGGDCVRLMGGKRKVERKLLKRRVNQTHKTQGYIPLQ